MKKLIGFKVILLVVVSLFCLWTAQAEADPIPGIYSTGVDNTNALLPNGSLDPHYTITLSADTRFTVPRNAIVADPVSYQFFNWVPNTANSQWVSLQREVGGYTAGLYKYDITFDLTGLNPATAVIAGQWAADNGGTIFLNGVSTGFTDPTPLGFQAFHPFTISGGFLPTLNTLEFQVTNVLDPVEGFSPTGLQVQLSGTANPVPEPASLLLFGFGLIGLAGVRRMMRGMQFKTNIMEGTMKTHICMAVMICGLLLVAAPAMAQVQVPGIQIFDDDVNGISVVTYQSYTGNPVITQETANLPGSVIWDFTYSSNRQVTETFRYNIYEIGTNAQNPPLSALSDTLLITLTPQLGPVVLPTIGHLEFFSGPLNDTPLLTPLPGGFTIIETGALQDLLVAGIPHPTDLRVLAFQSDLDPPTNVPEPASLLLFGFGLVGLAWVRRREELT